MPLESIYSTTQYAVAKFCALMCVVARYISIVLNCGVLQHMCVGAALRHHS